MVGELRVDDQWNENAMARNRYNITYGSRIMAKDRPHRTIETARDVCTGPDLDEAKTQQITMLDVDESEAVAIHETEIVAVEPIG
jgi:hypothetical protein